MNKHLLLIALCVSQISNSSCIYRKVIKCANYFKSSTFNAKYSQATQLWYLQQFSKLSDSDKKSFQEHFKAVITNNCNNVSDPKNKYIAFFNNQLKANDKACTILDSDEFNLMFVLARNVLKNYKEERDFAHSICKEISYPFSNRDLGYAMIKLNEVCNAEFDNKFADFRLEHSVENLTAFAKLVTDYYEFLQKCSDVMNEKV